MARGLPLVSGRQVVAKLQRSGWTLDRWRGSHMMMTRPNYRWTLAIPDHKEIGPGLLRRLIKQAGLTIHQFKAL